MERLTRKSYDRFMTKWDGSNGSLAFPRNKDVLSRVLLAIPFNIGLITLIIRHHSNLSQMGMLNGILIIVLFGLSLLLDWYAFLMHRHYDKYNKSLKVFKKKHGLSVKAIQNLQEDVALNKAFFSDDKVKTIEGEQLIVVKVDYYYRRSILTDNRMHAFSELTKI